MLSLRTIKNIQFQDIDEFLKKYKVPGRSSRITGSTSGVRFENYIDLIDEEINKENGSITSNKVDDFLFETLFYTNNNYHYLYKYDNFFADESTPASTARDYLSNSESLRFNDLLTNDIVYKEGEFSLCTTRLEYVEEEIIAVHLVILIDMLPLRYGNTHVFAGVTIDIKRKLIDIKFDYKQFEEIETEPLMLIKQIRDMLCGLGKMGKAYTDLQLNIISFNEAEPREIIYYLFEELTNEAEALLNSHVPPDTEDKIKKFMKEMGLSEDNQEYVEQIKAVMYQDIFESMGEASYKNGWVFRFHFREGDHTRATSTNEKQLPVYKAKTYWQLKELIHEEQEMYEAGFHWYMNQGTENREFVIVRIESRNDTMILHHYYKMRSGRKEKDEFVLRKIGEYLS
ncbi:hypothetical protein ACEOWG_001886 [Bacillus cereus]